MQHYDNLGGYLFLGIYASIMAWLVFDLFRRDAVFKVRFALKRDKDLYARVYVYLPEWESMIVNPRYWHLWTVKQWVRWADRQQGVK